MNINLTVIAISYSYIFNKEHHIYNCTLLLTKNWCFTHMSIQQKAMQISIMTSR